MNEQLFWSLVIVLVFIGPLVLGAIMVEQIAPRARRQIRRLDRLRKARAAQARQNTEAEARLDAERREAARWIADRCYWHQHEDRLP